MSRAKRRRDEPRATEVNGDVRFVRAYSWMRVVTYACLCVRVRADYRAKPVAEKQPKIHPRAYVTRAIHDTTMLA